MKPIKFKEANQELLPPKGQEDFVGSLPVNLGVWERDWVGITSAWELTPEELKVVKETGVVYLTLFTINQLPPVTMNVLNPFEAGLVKPLTQNQNKNGHTKTSEDS